MSLSAPELEQFVNDLVADEDRWLALIRHQDDERVYELIHDDGEVNAWLICWSEDQDTGWHDHDQSAAAIAVISGRVREDRLRLAGAPCSRELAAGTTFTMEPEAIHRVLHAGDRPAVTIHAYSPPLTRTGIYRTGSDGALERESLTIEEELRADAALI